MVLIDGKNYHLPKLITPENAPYTSSLLYYNNTLSEIEELQKQLKKYKRKIKKTYKELKKE